MPWVFDPSLYLRWSFQSTNTNTFHTQHYPWKRTINSSFDTIASNDGDYRTTMAESGTTTQDLSELLRSMTTSTTIERFDDHDPAAPLTSGQSSVNTATGTVIPMSHESNLPRLPQTSSVPTSISRSYKIWGIPTHTFCQVFSDRIVVGVTQLQKRKEKVSSGHIGSWVYCQASRSQIDPKQVDYELSTLLGGGAGSKNKGQANEKEIYARRIAERLLEKKSLPGGSERIVLLLGISLLPIPPSESIERFKVLVEVLVELVEEALRIVLGWKIWTLNQPFQISNQTRSTIYQISEFCLARLDTKMYACTHRWLVGTHARHRVRIDRCLLEMEKVVFLVLSLNVSRVSMRQG